ncbi:acetyl-coenzyme A synthetase N-terminal domain-containing protein [Mycobacterium tuberculosis]|uniref:acetyl-coenzyme A synthetase N-terminal domain-containing protein n=1 Tax=Mycobacterium tuberculosis TaxID=1773 RepID=UPI00272B296E|nr:acetyl-coenzyme A synthetase N-terminal domain-containing protein [Mycobacterium tuberculosis]
MGYAQVYTAWADDPEAFWLSAAKGIDWVMPPTHALDASRAPLYEWLRDWHLIAYHDARSASAGGKRDGLRTGLHGMGRTEFRPSLCCCSV